MIGSQLIYIFGLAGLTIWLMVSLIKKAGLGKAVFFSCCIIYLSFVISVTLFPMPLNGSMMDVPHNLIPFRTIISSLSNGFTPTATVQILGNIVISIPYGVAIEFIVQRKTTCRRLFFAVVFPLTVECAQYCCGLVIGVTYRSFDIDDFFLNIIGVLLGYCLFCVLPKAIKRYFDFKGIFSNTNDKT